MPAMPGMPGPFGAMDLKKTDHPARDIQGFQCARYQIEKDGQSFEIWATADAGLFPLRLLQRDYGVRHFGPPLLEEKWIELLQNKSLFPLEAVLRDGRGGERLSFKVTAIERKKIDETLCKLPEGFHEIQPPNF